MQAFALANTMPLPLTADAPGRHEFCRQAFNSHVECFSGRFRLLGSSVILQAKDTLVFQMRNALFGWRGSSVRVGVMPPGRGKPIVEVRHVEPLQRVHAFCEAVLP